MEFKKLDLNKAGHVATVFAAIVAAFALIIQLNEANNMNHNKSVSDWKKSAVYTIISNSPPSGSSFKNILDSYESITETRFKNTVLKGTTLTEGELITIVLELKKANLIYRSEERTFKEQVSADLLAAENLKKSIQVNNVIDLLFESLESEPCTKTATEMTEFISQEVGADVNTVAFSINANIGSQAISIKPEGQLCLMQDYNPQIAMLKLYDQTQLEFSKAAQTYSIAITEYENLRVTLSSHAKILETLAKENNELRKVNERIMELVFELKDALLKLENK